MHIETNTQRITATDIDVLEADRLRQEYEKQGIKVVIDSEGNKLEFFAIGFKTIPDPAGDPVIHIKFKKGLILYLTTPHPDSMNALRALKYLVSKISPQPTEIRDFMIDINEMRGIASKRKEP